MLEAALHLALLVLVLVMFVMLIRAGNASIAMRKQNDELWDRAERLETQLAHAICERDALRRFVWEQRQSLESVEKLIGRRPTCTSDDTSKAGK